MRIIISFMLFVLGWSNLSVQAANSENSRLKRIYTITSENLSSNASESLIELCTKAEAEARAEKDYDALFQSGRILVNAYCLRGDIGLAIDKAAQIYDEAKQLDSKLGLGLAYQALGSTYMYTNRFDEADEILDKAQKELETSNNDLVWINLLTQHLFVCAHQENPDKMTGLLEQASDLLPQLDSVSRKRYTYYILYYRLLTDILTDKPKQAELSYERFLQLYAKEDRFRHLYHSASSHYFLYKGDFKKALDFANSSLKGIKPNENINGFLTSKLGKASILERMGRYGEAYRLYAEVDAANDSLDVIKYSSQLDSLHISYWVDQMQLDAVARHNRFLTWIIFSSLLLLASITAVIIVIRQKNKILELSRAQLAYDNEQAERSIRSKTLFLSNMSHEIRTPLNGIVGFSQHLASSEDEDMDDETKQQCEENIRQNSDLLLKLINDVKDLSKLENDEMTFTYQVHDAVTICQNVLQTITAVKGTSATLSFDCPVDSLDLCTDSERLQQVLINLLMNATKFTEKGSIKLLLNVDRDRNEARFTVEDTGCGVPLEKQSVIFNRFEKFHENIQGCGLGLSICQLIVEHWHGKIWIDPGYTGGARFVFTHPLGNH